MYSMSPHLLQFQESVGAARPWSLWGFSSMAGLVCPVQENIFLPWLFQSSSTREYFSYWPKQETHTVQATQHGCLPSLLGNRDKGIERVYRKEKIFCTGQTRAAQGRTKIPCTGRRSQLTNQPRKDPFHLYSLSPHSPQFQQPAWLVSLAKSVPFPLATMHAGSVRLTITRIIVMYILTLPAQHSSLVPASVHTKSDTVTLWASLQDDQPPPFSLLLARGGYSLE